MAFAAREVEGRATRVSTGAAVRTDFVDSTIISKGAETRVARPSSNPFSSQRFGDYELIEEIARGGMGVVYKARQTSLNRTVAVKMIVRGQFNNPEFVARFRAEAEAAANLRHPNIVAIYEIGEAEGQHYFSMEYIEGRHLGSLISGQPLPAPRAADYTRKIAEAIHYAHQHGILHRDLKPSNVLIDLDGEPRVTDFGLAKRTSSTNTSDSELTTTGQVLGSPSYMSPEQAAGKNRGVDLRTDVYALGAILYALVTGRPPFMADTIEATLLQVTQTEPVPPRLLNPSVPRDIDTIVLKCLQKNRTSRYATAQELADDLARFLRHEPIRARPVALAEKVWRWCERKPALAGAFAAILVLAVAGVIGIVGQWRRAEHNARQEMVQRKEAERATLRALFGQSRAARLSSRAGQRFESLHALHRAALIEPSQQLRDEAIACLALIDIRLVNEWKNPGTNARAYAVDSSGLRFAASDGTGGIVVRAMSGGATEVELPGTGAPASALRFTGNSGYLSAFYDGGVLRLWDLRQRRVLLQRTNTAGASAAAVSEDGKFAAIGDGSGKLEIVVVASGEPLRSYSWTRPISLVEFQPHGPHIAVASAASLDVQLFNSSSANAPVLLPHRAIVRQMVWRGDGQALATVSSVGEISVWAMNRGQASLARALEAAAEQVAFDASGTVLAAAAKDQTLRLWDAGSGKPLIRADGVAATEMQLTRDGKLSCRVGDLVQQFEIALPASRNSSTAEHGPAARQSDCAVSADGQFVASATDNGVRLWRLDSFQETATINLGTVRSIAFDNAGGLLAGGIYGLHRLPFESLRLAGRNLLLIGPPQPIEAGPQSVGFSAPPQAGLIAVAETNEVLVFDSSSLALRKAVGTGTFHSITMSSDAKWIAAANWTSGTVTVWSYETGNVAATWPASAGTQVMFSPDAQWLAAAASPYCRLWKAGRWSDEAGRVAVEMGARGVAITFAPDMSCLAVATAADRVSLTSIPEGKVLASFEVPERDGIAALRFTPDSSRLICVSQSPGLTVWNIPSMRAGLAGIGLDWSDTPIATNAPALAKTAVTQAIVDVSKASSAHQTLRDLRTARAAIELEPEDWEAWRQLAQAQESHRDDRGVVESTTRALELQSDADLLDRRAWANLRLGRFDRAAADFKQLINFPGARAGAMKNLAYCYLESPPPWRDIAAAKELARERLQASPSDKAPLSRLSRAAYLEGNFEEAVQLANPLCVPQTQFMPCLIVAMAHARLGHLAEAEAIFDSALEPLLQSRDITELKQFFLPLAREADTVIADAKRKNQLATHER